MFRPSLEIKGEETTASVFDPNHLPLSSDYSTPLQHVDRHRRSRAGAEEAIVEAQERYASCLAKGRHLMRLMELTYSQASDALGHPAESQHSQFAACSMHGWIRRTMGKYARRGETWPLDTLDRVRLEAFEMLDSLGVGRTRNANANVEGVQWQHILPWDVGNGTGGKATEGNYFNLYEPETRAIYRMENNSPSFASQGRIQPLPNLRHWSDLAFLTYAHFSGRDVHPPVAPTPQSPLPPPHYIVSINIVNDVTWSVVERILVDKTGGSDMSRLPPWPGWAFSGWSEEGAALIGSPIGAGTAWMLVERKLAMGVNVISRAVVFASDQGTQLEDPMLNMLVEVEPMPGGGERDVR